jgi:diguanylate cyclase (GGDEF)-like protein
VVFWVVMIVAVANVSLGFAAAVYLARRYQRCIVDAIGSAFSAGSFGPDDLSELDAAFAQPPADGAGATDAAAQRADAAPSTPPETAAEPQSSVPLEAAAQPRSSPGPEAAVEPESSKTSEAPATPKSAVPAEVSAKPEPSVVAQAPADPQAAAPADASEKPDSPEVPETPTEPKAAALPETPAAAESSAPTDGSEKPDSPEVPETPTEPKAAAPADGSVKPDSPEVPETPPEPKAAAPTDGSEKPDSPEVPETPTQPTAAALPEAPAAAESSAPADGAAKPESPEVPETPAKPEPSVAPETVAELNGVSRSRNGEARAEPSGTRPVAAASAARQEPRPPETTQGYLKTADADEPANADRPSQGPRERPSQQTVQYDGEKATPPGVFRIEAAAPDSTGDLSYAESLAEADQENLEPQSVAYDRVQETYEDRGDRPMVCGSISPEAEAEKPLVLAATETARPAGRIEYPVESRLTGVLNRDRLEAELESLRQEDPEHARPLSLALVDLDEFGRVNERYGFEAGNRILRAVAKLLAVESRDRYAVARFSGQRFVILVRDYDIRSATRLVERIRQTIENCEFRYQEFSIRITVSCGVTAAAPPETSESLFARAEEALGEAKRYGRNRTFFREGHYPSPVVPPKHTLRPRVITL